MRSGSDGRAVLGTGGLSVSHVGVNLCVAVGAESDQIGLTIGTAAAKRDYVMHIKTDMLRPTVAALVTVATSSCFCEFRPVFRIRFRSTLNKNE